MGDCFSCHKKLGIINNGRNTKIIQKRGYTPPKGMTKHDKLCQLCLGIIVNEQERINEQVKKQQTLPVDLVLENASTSAMISGVLILITSFFALFLVAQFGWYFLLAIPELMLLGWGLYKLGSRKVIPNPLELITKIQILTEKVRILEESASENNKSVSQMSIEELEEKITKLRDEK